MSNLQTKEVLPECKNRDLSNPINHIIFPRMGDIGNFKVHRALPAKERQMVGPFIFWDQMGPGEFMTGQGLDVRPHPHIGLSTLTYLFQGEIDHRDSLGFYQKITPGDVNLMTAGSGIVHSERTDKNIRNHKNFLYGIQSWIALPKKYEETNPNFVHHEKANLPLIDQEGIKGRLISGNLWGLKSPVELLHYTLYADIEIRPGAKFSLPKDTEERGVYLLEGDIEIGREEFPSHRMLVFRPGDNIVIKAQEGSKSVRLLLLGGAAMDGPRYIWWNFVSSSQERIEQAKRAWQKGKFKKVEGDIEFIPLP